MPICWNVFQSHHDDDNYQDWSELWRLKPHTAQQHAVKSALAGVPALMSPICQYMIPRAHSWDELGGCDHWAVCSISHASLPALVVSVFQQQLRTVTGGTAAILWTLQRAPLDGRPGRSSQMDARCASTHSTAHYVLIHVYRLNVCNIFQEISELEY